MSMSKALTPRPPLPEARGSYLVVASGPIAGAMGYSLLLLRSRLDCHGVAAESSPRRQPWETKALCMPKPREGRQKNPIPNECVQSPKHGRGGGEQEQE